MKLVDNMGGKTFVINGELQYYPIRSEGAVCIYIYVYIWQTNFEGKSGQPSLPLNSKDKRKIMLRIDSTVIQK